MNGDAVAGAASADVPLIVCEGLVRRYGRNTALAGIDLVLRAGPPIALVGPNGAGKTTLMSVLSGFVRAGQGRVRVLGERPGAAALAGRLAALPQDAAFDPRLGLGRQLRVLGELQGLGRRRARVEVSRALERVGLAGVERRRPGALSHGMRKRAALAQTLLGSPQLVLLDEPTAGLDPESARAVRELVAEASTRCTFLISSHNLDELERLCGSVVQLESGALVRHEALGVPAGRKAGASSSSAGMNGVGARRNDERPDAVDGRTAVGAGASGEDELTVGLVDVPDDAFHDAVRGLPGVRSARRLRRGDWRIVTDDASAFAAALLALLGERSWRWRHVTRGRSLEERLYGD